MTADPTAILRQYFGYNCFREGQKEIIDSIISGRDALCIMPTGAGKSICYQVPALSLSGITLVVSPLISLMKDQVAAITDAGVAAAYINSSLDAVSYREIMQSAKNGAYKLIYIAPERLSSPSFIQFTKKANISFVAIDEAHCVSQWGQDFRPGYLNIADFINELPRRPIVAAFTATATSEVSRDIQKMLNLSDPLQILTGFNRSNLYFSVEQPPDKYSALCAYLEKHKDKSGIVYCLTRKTVDEVCSALCKDGYRATRYHAGLSDNERIKNQENFIYDHKSLMVATNAFGMGIDKSNVSFVVHYNMPKNMESYYQEAGRAGRDGSNAECVLFYSGQDVRTNQFLIENSDINENISNDERLQIRQRDMNRLKNMTIFCKTSKCLRGYILSYFGETAPAACNSCSNCNTDFDTVDITIESQKIISCVYRLLKIGRKLGASSIIDILRGSKKEKILSQKLDKLSTYGIINNSSSARLRSIIDFLIENEFLAQTDDEYPVILLAGRTNEVIRQKISVTMKFPKKSRVQNSAPTVHAVNPQLYDELRKLKNKLATEENVPSYIVFTDSTLLDMCRKTPRNNNEFLDVSGVGKLKLEKYGKVFLETINNYLSKNNRF